MTEQQIKIIEEYIQELKQTNRSVKNPPYHLKHFFAYIDENDLEFLRLRVPEAQDFQLYLATTTTEEGTPAYCKATISTMVGSLTTFYEYLRKRRLVPLNPFREIRKVKRMKGLPKNILNEEQMRVLLTRLKEFWRGANLHERRKLYKAHVAAELMYSTGARINEVTKLTVKDVDFSRNTVTVRDDKTGKSRECILNEYAASVVRIYIDEARAYVLFGKNGGDATLLFGSKTNLKMWLNAFLGEESKKLGFPKITTHHFRHAVGYHLLRAGCDIRYIQELLGHENLSTTEIYTKVDKEDLRGVLDRFHPRRLIRVGDVDEENVSTETLAPQFDKLTDRGVEAPVPSKVEA
jgi:integrase/recombinase XerD